MSAEAAGKKKVLVVGGGPAGLGAAIRLLEQARDQVEVTLVHQGHHLGGRAASYTDAQGRVVEHGIHMMFGFYKRLRALMVRAGLSLDKSLIKVDTLGHLWEDWSQSVHELQMGKLGGVIPHVGYDGVHDDDKLDFLSFMASAYVASRDSGIEQHDDLCFRQWAIEAGLDPKHSHYGLFRTLRQPYFNYPHAVSAYHVLQAFNLMSTPEDAAIWYVRGGFSDVVWDPIGRYYTDVLGGALIPFTMVTGWEYDGRRITGVRASRPDGAGHHDGTTSWQRRPPHTQLPRAIGSDQVFRDFDIVVSAVPHTVFQSFNRDDERMWQSPYFKRLLNIRSVETLSMTIQTRKPVMGDVHGMLGFPPPMGNVANMKEVWDHLRDDPDCASYLYLSGTGARYEHWTDEQIIEHTVDFLSSVPGMGDVRQADIAHIEFHRNHADFERLVLTEPGINQFRPEGPRTPFSNLFVAGDWVRNEIDLVVSMEGALQTGYNAADEILGQLGAP
jgi:uncharacterized protein with NAD-binding domain and iron-sulfur cluster